MPAAVVGLAPIAAVSAVMAASKLPAFGFCRLRPRYSSTLPLNARLRRRNVAGVSNLPFDVNPPGKVKGNDVPPAASSAAALSSDAEIEASAFGLQTNAAGGSSIGWLTSIAIPSESRSSRARYSAIALKVRVSPFVADASAADSPVAEGSALRMVLPARTVT